MIDQILFEIMNKKNPQVHVETATDKYKLNVLMRLFLKGVFKFLKGLCQ